MTRSPRSRYALVAFTLAKLCALREGKPLLKLFDGTFEKGSPAGSLFLNPELQLNGCLWSVAQMRVLSSQRPDFSRRHSRHTQWFSRHGGKSRRTELAADIYATDRSHPFSCSSKPLCAAGAICYLWSVNPAKLYA